MGYANRRGNGTRRLATCDLHLRGKRFSAGHREKSQGCGILWENAGLRGGESENSTKEEARRIDEANVNQIGFFGYRRRTFRWD